MIGSGMAWNANFNDFEETITGDLSPNTVSSLFLR